MQTADRLWLLYDDELERTLADAVENHGLAPFVFVDVAAARRVLGYHTAIRGHSPLRLPDVLDEVARRCSALLPSYGIETRDAPSPRQLSLAPDELLVL